MLGPKWESALKRGFILILLLVVIALAVLRGGFLRTELVAQESSEPVESTASGSVADVKVHRRQDKDGYLGREVCRECHAANYELHGMHGHAHTFALASDEKIASKFAGRNFDYGEPYGNYEYDQDEEALSVRLSGESEESFPL